MSRAETPSRRDASGTPAAPRLTDAIRSAASDFYFNSWRLVPANLLWGLAFVALLLAIASAPAALLLSPLLAFPTVGIFRLAALIVRGGHVSFWDGLAAWRSLFLPTLLLGVALSVSGAVLGTNVMSGFAQGDPLGWALATIAGWGIVATWVISCAAWPLLADPAREARPIGERGRLAALLVLAQPRRMAGLAAALFVVLAISTIAFAAVVTISVAFSALVASHLVLPAADRLESSLGARDAARRSSSD